MDFSFFLAWQRWPCIGGRSKHEITMSRISPLAPWVLVALVISATSCSTYSTRTTDSPKDDSDLAAVLVECRHQFSELKGRLGLSRYPELIMPGGSREVAAYRYDLGHRFLFVEVNNRTGLVNRAFYVTKKKPDPDAAAP